MFEKGFLVRPKTVPPLDAEFRPAVLANHRFLEEVERSGGGTPLVLALERAHGSISRFETKLFESEHPFAKYNHRYIERILKFLLWQRGAWKVTVGGPPSMASFLRQTYAQDGERSFDASFMGKDVYERPFTVESCSIEDVPAASEAEKALGRHLDGYRIGFDLGASDLKVSAVVDGEAIFSTEIEWEPRKQTTPAYHRDKIKAALQLAASKMPKLEAIGGSSAGVYIDNRPMIASLFRGIPSHRFEEVRRMFLEFRDEMGVPLEIVNDGEVTALAGSMSLEDNGVLGIALGSSEAAGYVTLDGNITDWLNELAFAPVDYAPTAPIDEWSGDRGCGALYFSQQCVFRLAPKAGISIPPDLIDARKLKVVQERLEAGHEGAVDIWKSMGVYMGYSIAHYADYYDLKNVLILGRCTSGTGGQLILDGANALLRSEFPALASQLHIQLPDEKSRRVGQSIAAASLPKLRGTGE
jgi:predicted NBD/HSP70 family sugar kinase